MTGTRLRPAAVLRAKRLDALETASQRRLCVLWNAAALVLSAFAITVASLLMAAGSFGFELFLSYFRHPLLVLLNFLPMLLLQTLLYALFGRQWLAFLVNAALVLSASAGNLYKLRFRFEPFMFSDIGALGAAFGVAHNYDLTPNARILFAIALAVAGTVLLALLCRLIPRRKTRGLLLACVLVCVWPLWHFAYASSAVYETATRNEDAIDATGEAEVFVTKGFVYPFLHSIRASDALPPEGYDTARAAALLGAYSDEAIPAEQKVNLLVFQLESFRDIRSWGVAGVREEAYAVWDALKAESFHGALCVNNFAGGTANTERAVLAGARGVLNPRADYPSYVWYLRDQGYETFGNHPYFCYYYDRFNINPRLGFESYRYYEDSYADLYGEPTSFENSDGVFFREVLREYRERDAAGQPLFSFNVTLQGHYPYRTDEAYYSGFLDGDYPQELFFALDNYLGTVHDTQKCVAELIDALRADETPVVVLFYGDHCPNIGDSSYVSTGLGADMDPAGFAGFLNMYSTEYLIWANDAARSALGREVRGEGPCVSACYLMDVLFEELGWSGSAFMQFSRATRDILPVMNANGFYVENGVYTAALDEKGKAALRDYDCVYYYQASTFKTD